MNFTSACGPLQFYIVISMISVIIQIYMTYTTKKWTWVNEHKMAIFGAAVFNIIVFILYGTIINTLCKSNKNMAWLLIFMPFVLAFIAIILVLSGILINTTSSKIKELV